MWFKVDDQLAFHPKVVAAGNAAMGLWVRAGAWSAAHLTDGFIPHAIALQLGRETTAKVLLKVGLWLEVDGGYQFHEWRDFQPTRSAVLARRKADAERLQRWREQQRRETES